MDLMKYRKLGRTGFEVSEISHGLWGMSGWTGSNDDESRKALQLSADLGCNFFDTAWAYGEGKSDRLLGELLHKNRGRKLYAASKIPPKNRKWPASSSDALEDVFPAEHVLKYADCIRKNLGVERIDLLQFHVWDDSWAGNEMWMNTVRKLKAEGLIAAFGLSLNRWQPNNGIRALETGCVDTVQVIYNIFDQAPEDELFPCCKKLDIGVIARVPLDEGSLGARGRSLQYPISCSMERDRKSTRLNSSHVRISYAAFCLKKKIAQTAAIAATAMRTDAAGAQPAAGLDLVL